MKQSHPVGRFLIAGVANTMVGLAFIYATRALGGGEVASNATGYAFGVAISFVLNRQWTFGDQGCLLAGAARFLVVMLVAWGANIAALLQCMRWGMAPAVAQAAAVVPYALVSYIGCRWWAFASRIETMGGELT